MSLFTRMAEGAGVGGVLGTAIGALVGGAATTAAVAFTAPVSIHVCDRSCGSRDYINCC